MFAGKRLGYWLIGGAVVVWVFTYMQQQKALAAGTITSDQKLTATDLLFSPAGVAAGFGVYFVTKRR